LLTSAAALSCPRRAAAVVAGTALVLLAGFGSTVQAAAAGKVRPHRADATLADWRGAPTNLGGRWQISRGELVYTDYLYDDYGADLDGTTNATVFRSSARTSGDYRYPGDARYGSNAGDLRELRVAYDRHGLHALVALQTMLDPDAAIATIAIDTDGNPATGSGVWPDGAGVRAPGADRFITVWAGGARLTDALGATRDLRHATHQAARAFEVDVPARALGSVTKGARVWVGVGLAAPGGRYAPQAGATALFDTGCQGAETYAGGSAWSDQRQSAAIAGGDLSAFSCSLRPGALRSGATRSFKPRPGFYNRIFRSAHDYGEGIELRQGGLAGSSAPQFLGRYQPYALYIPHGYRPKRRTPLLLDLHALNRNQNMFASVSPHQLTQLGDERGSLILTPLGRGTDGWYLDAGLIDVLEAWRDARRAYRADPDRTSIAGYSMGGYGTYRLGLLMPDRFARAVVYVGPQVFGLWSYPLPPLVPEQAWTVPSNTNLIVANGLHLPFEITDGDLDTLVPIGGAMHQADAFRAAGDPYRFYRYPAAGHFTFAGADEWSQSRDWLGGARLVRNPQRVRYVRYPSMDLPDAGLTFDGAYWVDGMMVRDAPAADSHGSIDASTAGLGGRQQNLIDEGTTAAPSVGGLSGTVSGQHYEPGARLRRANSFQAQMENLAAVSLDTRRMGLDTRRRIHATLTGDGATILRLRGHWPCRVGARLDGERIRAHGRRTVTTRVDLGAPGPHALTITPRRCT
jgi:predicted esterase